VEGFLRRHANWPPDIEVWIFYHGFPAFWENQPDLREHHTVSGFFDAFVPRNDAASDEKHWISKG
jgi:hypothetical protein